jgi:hypothetical protein
VFLHSVHNHAGKQGANQLATFATTDRQHCHNHVSIWPATGRHLDPMNSATQMTQVRSALASAVETFEPSPRVRFKTLAPFKNEVQDLKGRGASFATIAEILNEHSVQVSHETVRRFYRETIEKKPSRRKRSRNGLINAKSRKPVRNEGSEPKTPRPATPKAERGPRIARIEDL